MNAQNESGNKSRVIIIVMGVVIAILASGLIWLLVSKQQVEQQNVELTDDKNKLVEEVAELEKKREQLESELQTMDADREQIKAKYEELQRNIQAQQGKIAQLLKEGKLNAGKLEEYKGKVAQLEHYNQKYQERITQLEAEIAALRQENQDLKTKGVQKDSLITNLESTAQENRQKIAKGAQLIASDFQMTGLNDKKKEFDEKIRAKRINTIKLCFTINKNDIAESGKRDLYLVLQGPGGKTLKSISGNSGYFSINRKENVYSSKSSLDYNRKAQNVCLEYVRGESEVYLAGTYTAWLYIQDPGGDDSAYEIGKTEFELK